MTNRIIMYRGWLEGPIAGLGEGTDIVFYEELLIGLRVHRSQSALHPIYVAAEHIQVTFVQQLRLSHDGHKALDELSLQRF